MVRFESLQLDAVFDRERAKLRGADLLTKSIRSISRQEAHDLVFRWFTELEELLRRAPDYLAAYLQLGMLLQGENRFADAKGVLERGQQVARKQGNSHTLSELTSALEALPV